MSATGRWMLTTGLVIGAMAIHDLQPAAAITAAESRFVAVAPCRLFDSRTAADDRILPQAPRAIEVAGHCGVPPDATAVAATVTSVNAQYDGYVSVVPTGTPLGETSSLVVRARDVRANGVIVPLVSGEVTVENAAGGHVVIDVTGAFVPSGPTAEGRFVPVPIQRLQDTRTWQRPAPGDNVWVPLPASFPRDVTAVSVTITTAESAGSGFLTAFAATPGASPPWVSTLNTDRPGQTRSAAAIVPSTEWGIFVFTSSGDHVIVDVNGYFTGPSASPSTSGLFVPSQPFRMADTRVVGPKIHPGGTREWPVTHAPPTQVGALAATVAIVNSDAHGWTVAYPARTLRPYATTVTARRGETVANMAIVPVSTAGVALHSPTGGHALIDVSGWFTTTTGPLPATLPAATNEPPGPGRTLIVTDSTGASMRWHPPAQQHLVGFPWVLDGEACRVTAGVSCTGNGGRRPSSAVQAIQTASGPFDTIVVMTGYNDWHTVFPGNIDMLMDEARRAGARRVVWLTLRTGHDYSRPGWPNPGSTNHERNNAHLLAARLRHDDLILIDWSRHAIGSTGWFTDRVHISNSGSIELAKFITSELRRVI